MPKDNPFSNRLGKATQRGVRKCPKCGTVNGTRGFSCKNKSCDVVFKESGGPRKYSTEACRLDTGTSTKVFSVRVRDKGPDYRGFVQLPVSPNGTLHNQSLHLDSSALCFVEPCQRNFNTSILQCHEQNKKTEPVLCSHIKAAMMCYTDSVPLELNTMILQALNIPPSMKEEIWDLLAESVGPVVQKVSKNIMAVKCKASPKHPLGYLHFCFNILNKGGTECKFSCSCSTFKDSLKKCDKNRQGGRCSHFYACICSFVNNDNLYEEFAPFVRLELPVGLFDEGGTAGDFTISTDSLSEMEVFKDEVTRLLDSSGILAHDNVVFSSSALDVENQPLQVTMEGTDSLNFAMGRNSFLDAIENVKELSSEQEFISTSLEPIPSSVIDLPDLGLHYIDINLCQDQESDLKSSQPSQHTVTTKKNVKSSYKLPKRKKIGGFNSTNTSMNFLEWLGTVIENINQIMHYQFSGNPNPLVFHIPQKFFDRLRERIVSVRKKKLPSNVTTFTRTDEAPLGTFTKYTWNLLTVTDVKSVFDAPNMHLKIVRTFRKQKENCFEPLDSLPKDDLERLAASKPAIRPVQYKTYLKVGSVSVDQLIPIPFTIEWIPDVLPLNHIGELRIKFHFGHIPPKI